MRRSLSLADQAARALARSPVMILCWWLAVLPPLAAGYGLAQRALRAGLPTEASELMQLLLWSCLLVLGGAWYQLGIIVLHRIGMASLWDGPASEPISWRRQLDLLPAVSRAQAARLALSLAGLIPLGAGLPLARVYSAAWSSMAASGARTSPAGLREPPSLEVVVLHVASWPLVALLCCNMVVLEAWMIRGTLLDAATLAPQLSDPRLWAVAGLLALSLVEPWRVCAMLAALGPHGEVARSLTEVDA